MGQPRGPSASWTGTLTAGCDADESIRWKKRKYFSAAGEPGVFSVWTSTKGGERRVLELFRLARTKVERHIKVRGTAHPYDPKYTEYFQKRRYPMWRIR